MEHKEISQAVWECANQEIYDLKRDVARLTLLEKDYLTEIESLQAKQNQLQARVNMLEDDKRSIDQLRKKSMEEAEQALLQKDEELEALRELLNSALKSKSTIDNADELKSITMKVHDLEEENTNLKEENSRIMTIIGNLGKDNQYYEETINNLKEQLNSLNENYECKAENLKETKQLLETLQDELMVTKTELELVKNKPVESNTQGNSLFAEVDERRLQLQTKVNKMKNHYEQMKQQITRLEEQVFKMRTENGTLKQNWEKEIEERANDKYDIEEGYKNRIQSLESLIKDYKKELESRPIVSTNTMKKDEMAFIEYRIELKNKEIEKLLNKIDQDSFKNMIHTEQSREATKEANSWHFKYINIKDKLEKKEEIIANLERKIRELEIASIIKDPTPSPPPESIPALKPAISNTIEYTHIRDSNIDTSRLKKRSCSLLQENKEVTTEYNRSQKDDQNIKKKVQFTEDTKENQVNSRRNCKGGKLIICEPTVLKKREF